MFIIYVIIFVYVWSTVGWIHRYGWLMWEIKQNKNKNNKTKQNRDVTPTKTKPEEEKGSEMKIRMWLTKTCEEVAPNLDRWNTSAVPSGPRRTHTRGSTKGTKMSTHPSQLFIAWGPLPRVPTLPVCWAVLSVGIGEDPQAKGTSGHQVSGVEQMEAGARDNGYMCSPWVDSGF